MRSLTKIKDAKIYNFGINFSWTGKKLAALQDTNLSIESNYGLANKDFTNQVWQGDNLLLLQQLLKIKPQLEKIGGLKLIYIDPPFATGKKQSLTIKNSDARSYNDNLPLNDYLTFIYQRVYLMHQLLAADGSIFVHCDYRVSAYIKLILDEIFGEKSFVNEIVWQSGISNSHANLQRFAKSHDTIFYYRKSADYFIWNNSYQNYSQNHLKIYRYTDDNGRYQLGPCDAPCGGGYDYSLGLGEKKPSRGYSMPYAKALEWLEKGILVVKKDRVPLKKWYLDTKGVKCKDLWLDDSRERGIVYATQKPTELIERIILACSNEHDLIADFFCGSSSSLMAASKLNRHFIGCDINKQAIEVSLIRLLAKNKDIAFSFGRVLSKKLSSLNKINSENNELNKKWLKKLKIDKDYLFIERLSANQIEKINSLKKQNYNLFINQYSYQDILKINKKLLQNTNIFIKQQNQYSKLILWDYEIIADNNSIQIKLSAINSNSSLPNSIEYFGVMAIESDNNFWQADWQTLKNKRNSKLTFISEPLKKTKFYKLLTIDSNSNKNFLKIEI